MKKFSIKELSRIETEIDKEIQFAMLRHQGIMRKDCASRDEALRVAKESIEVSSNKVHKLLDAKFAIRGIKQAFNVEKGINDKTLHIALLTQEQEFVDTYAKHGDVSSDRSYSSNSVTFTPGISAESQDKLRAESRNIQRQIQRLKDSCQGINNQGSVELDEASYQVLVDAGLIDA